MFSKTSNGTNKHQADIKIAEVREKYLKFFAERGHTIIPSASLVPENDPTTLFTGSGMQPMLPYLLGQTHPAGKRVVDSQKCFRAQDIEEVGDNRHTTFFEMLGNWSLGSYWKEEQLGWIFEFLTKELKIPKEKLWVTCFEGDRKLGLPKDDESSEIWQKLGLSEDHIRFYGVEKNWWSRSGTPDQMPVGEPGGPDSEMFYEFTQIPHDKKFGEECHPNCDCGRFMEIGNSVFMEYRKVSSRSDLKSGKRSDLVGVFEKLPQRNVDFGGGLERITAAANDEPDIFKLDVFHQMLSKIEANTSYLYSDDNPVTRRPFRIMLDHLRAAVFLMSDGVLPSNTDAGYFVRRLIRRAIKFGDKFKVPEMQLTSVVDTMADLYFTTYPSLRLKKEITKEKFLEEEKQFRKTLSVATKEYKKIVAQTKEVGSNTISGHDAFVLFSTYGLPFDVIVDMAGDEEPMMFVEGGVFTKEFLQHQELSRSGSEQKFKGGLADTSDMSVRYHTATHLLHQALRDVLGDEVRQKGSNITPERLRFDFAFPRKMTEEEKKKAEEIVNGKIKLALPVRKVVLPFAEAEKTGALHFFGEKYGDSVNVYYIGDSIEKAYSKEFCGGPHAENTGALASVQGPDGTIRRDGVFKILKEEAVSAGVRRIKAIFQ